MKATEIRKLVKIVEESNIVELEVSRWRSKVRIVKNYSSNNRNPVVISSSSQPVQHIVEESPISTSQQTVEEQSIPKPAKQSLEESALKQIVTKKAKEYIEICSPMVGTFYRASAPDADPYVEVDDHITPGKILCVVEAMKLMNEIEAEVSGKIVEILVENAQPVEYNQPLFKVLPD